MRKSSKILPAVTVWLNHGGKHLGSFLLDGDWTLDMVFTACNRIDDLPGDIQSMFYMSEQDEVWALNLPALIAMRCALDMEVLPSMSVGDVIEASGGLQHFESWTVQGVGFRTVDNPTDVLGNIPHPHQPNQEALT